jgi:hypothetical protein
MDDVDNLGQVRKVAIVVVALFLVHGSNDRKRLYHCQRETKQSKKIYGYVASAVHYGLLALALLIASQQFGIEATSILALFGAVGFGLGLALQEHSPIYLLMVLPEGKYKLEIQYTWARCMERSCDMGLSTVIKTNDGVLVHVPNRDEYHGSHKHESKRYYTGDCQVPHQKKCRYIQIDIRSKDAIYSTPGVCEQKPIKVWISDVLETNILGHAMVYVNIKICRKLN